MLTRDLGRTQSTVWRSASDFGPVIGGVRELNSYVNPLSTGPSLRRALLQANASVQADESIDKALAELQNILDNENSGVPEALDVLSSLRSTFSSRDPSVSQAQSVGQIVRDAMEILFDSGSSTIGLSTVGSSLGSAGMAAESLTGTEDSWENFSRLQETIEFARGVVRRQSPAGFRSYANSTQVGVGVSRSTRRETARANIEVDGVPTLGRDSPVLIRMFMPPEAQAPFRQWCSQNSACNSTDILTLYFTYIRDPALVAPSNVIQTVRDHFDHDDIDPVPVSGVLETQFRGFKSEDSSICDAQREQNCAMDLTIPVIPEGVNGVPPYSGRNLACVRLRRREEFQNFAAEVVQDGIRYNGLSSSAVCRTKLLGRHMLVSYNAPPGPPPSPFSPPSPPLPPSTPEIGGGGPTSICQSRDARLETSLSFALDYESHNNAEFERDVQRNLQRNLPQKYPGFFSFSSADMCPSFVTVLSLSPGSVIVGLSIELGGEKSSSDAEKLKNKLQSLDKNEAKDLFDDDELRNNLDDEAFFSAEDPVDEPQPGGGGGDDDDGDGRDDAEVLGPAIAIPVFFFLLALAGVAYFAYKRNRFGVTYLARSDTPRSPELV